MIFRDNIKCSNILIIEVPEAEEREQGIQNIFELIITRHFLYLVKEKDTEVQGV